MTNEYNNNIIIIIESNVNTHDFSVGLPYVLVYRHMLPVYNFGPGQRRSQGGGGTGPIGPYFFC